MDFWLRLFDTTGFMPRRICGIWTPGLILLHNLSDFLIWTAYLAIPIVLVAFAYQRRHELPFRHLFWLFGLFILACGTTHLMDIFLFYWPAYRLAGVIKLVTAVASWGTVAALVYIVPRALGMRSPDALQTEIEEREEVEAQVRQLNAELESRVVERTAQLSQTVALLEQQIAERQQSEEALSESQSRFASIVNAAMDAIISMDHEGRVIEFNPAAQRIFGYEREAALGRYLADLIVPPELREQHWKGLARYLETGQATVLNQRLELTAMRADGSILPVELTITRPSLDGPPTFTGYLRDVTERRQAEDEIQQRTAELQAANKELEAFSYTVSHDLRAPVRAMIGFTRILSEEHASQLSDEAQRYLRRVVDNAEKMGNLVDDLLEFSRLGRQTMNTQTAAPDKIARQVWGELAAEREGRAVEFTLGDLPPCRADPALLKQVIFNLLANAIKFTRGREPAEIEFGCREENGETVYFVRDNGAGFDMQYAGKLFGVFQRLHRTSEFEGTGVGLAIVQRHGGRIWAESEVGKGAIFYFSIEKEAAGVTGFPPARE